MNNKLKNSIKDKNSINESEKDYADGVLVNPEDKDYADGNLMRVCLWCGAGYNLDVFYVYTNDAEYALNKTVAYCEEHGYDGLIFPVEETIEEEANYCKEEFEAFKKENPEEDKDMFYFLTEYLDYVYVDATMEGASKPYFVRGENLRIERVDKSMNESEEYTDGKIINPEDKGYYTDEHLMKVCLWNGKGHNLNTFYVYVRGNDEESALNKVITYCEKNGYNDLLYDINEIEEEAMKYFENDFSEPCDNYDELVRYIKDFMGYIYIDASEEGASKPYYICNHNLEVDEADKSMNESEEGPSTDYKDDIQIYMNTWANYNEYGADLSQYGIKDISDGWLSIDEALEFCDKHAEDEPFLNDIDNYTDLKFNVGDYNNAVSFLNELKNLLDVIDTKNLRDDIGAIYEAWSDYEAVDGLDETNMDKFVDFLENGEYYIYNDIANEYDLGYMYINDVYGGPYNFTNMDSYLDTDKMKEDWQEDIDSQFEKDDPEWFEVTDDIVQDDIQCALSDRKAAQELFDKYFDYAEYGKSLYDDGGFYLVSGNKCVEIR